MARDKHPTNSAGVMACFMDLPPEGAGAGCKAAPKSFYPNTGRKRKDLLDNINFWGIGGKGNPF